MTVNVGALKSDRAQLVSEMRAAMNDQAKWESLAKQVETIDATIAREERQMAFETAKPVAKDSLEGELREYNIGEALNQFANGRVEGRAAEIHQELVRGAGSVTKGLRIPISAFSGREQRAEIVTSTSIANQRFETLAPYAGPESVVLRSGARVLDGLSYGKIVIPVQTGSTDSNISWVPESGSVGLGDMAFSNVTLQPHTAGVYLKISRRALVTNSVGLRGVVSAELNKAMGRIIDQAVLVNAGGEAPKGITGTGGLVAATSTLETEVDMVAADLIDVLEAANNDGDTFFISHAVASAARKFRTLNKEPVPLEQQFYGKSVFVSNLLSGKTIVHARANDILVGYFNQSGAASVDVTIDTATYSSEGALKIAVHSDVDSNLLRSSASASWVTLGGS